MTRRQVARALALAASSLATGSVRAQAKYPDRPVRVILPFAAGGVADITARLVAEGLGNKLGQNFVIENNPGAGGITAARAALSGDKDGYTLTLLTNGTAISVPLFNHLPFDPLKDFTPISIFGTFETDFVVASSSNYKTLGDVLTAARAKPGTLNIGTVNVGSTQNLTAELFKSMANIDVVIVPFRSTPEVVIALLRGDVQMAIDFYAPLKPSLDSGQARAIATGGTTRSVALPNIPDRAGGRRSRFRSDGVEWTLCAGRHAQGRHRHVERDAARSAGRSGAEETRARARHRRQGLHARGARWADALRHRQVGQRDRARPYSQAMTLRA